VQAIGIRFQAAALAVLAPLMAIVFWSGANDPVNLPKMSLAVTIALLLVAVSAVRMAVTRRFALAMAPSGWAAGAFGFALLLATATSDVPGMSVAGIHGRNDGLLLYGACVALFFVGLRALDEAGARWLLLGLLAGGLFSATYGLLQHFNIDAINWADTGISPVIGAFGNPDFESGYLGIVVPAAAWGALTRTWGTAWRLGSLLLAVGCLVVALISSSVQGPLAAIAGLGVVAVGALLNRAARWVKWTLVGMGGVAALTVGVVVAGLLTGVGPGDRLSSAGSLEARRWYWTSALRMWRHHPVTGVGPDRYGAYFRSVRPEAAAAVNNYSDAAHSVPLQMLSTGGLLLAASYAAFVLLVGLALVTGLRRLDGERRLVLAGAGGAWLAYQVQSLVSIDEPGLAVTHWLLAACVVAVGAPPRMLERLLPGAVVPVVRKGRAAPAPQPPAAVWSGVNVTLCVSVTVLGLVGLWQALAPLRADHAARSAAVDLVRGDGNAAFANVKVATRLAPYEQVYWLQQGKFLEQVKQPALAAAAYASGIEHDSRAYDVLLAGAVLAKAQNDVTVLDRYKRQLIRVDPSGGWRSVVGG
jgi:O-antigen ligase